MLERERERALLGATLLEDEFRGCSWATPQTARKEDERARAVRLMGMTQATFPHSTRAITLLISDN